jgi:MHS family proline/betaine transporter-like MFS transporter
VLLVGVRLVQGLSVGGEFSSSVTYLVETAPDDHRGRAGSWANTGSIAGMLLGSGAAALVTTVLSADVVEAWGWRVPFLFGGVLGLTSILLRTRLPQSPHFAKHHGERGETSPLLEAFTSDRKAMLQAIVFASAYGALFYVPLVYLPEWLHSQAGLDRDVALRINTAASGLLLALIPVAGWLGDRLLRRTRLIAAAMLCISVLSWPLYVWMSGDGVFAAIVVQVIFVILIALPLGSAPAMFVELFPSRHRLSGYSVAYNLGLGVVGGATPMICTWLIDVTGYPTAPSVYMLLMAVVGLLAILTIPDRSREPLR